MHYQSLYRRYRPQRFGDVLGQAHVSETLRNAVHTGRVGHAYLFSGPRGCGKTTSARILAKALNCLDLQQGEPCETCESCIQVQSGASLDVIELDAASNNGVDNMRELVARASLGTAGRRKVYIVDEVHMLSSAASNALLKTLEEPPDHVVFVLATTDPQKVLPTIRSRTQHFEFRLFAFPVLLDLVRSVATDAGLAVDEATLQAVARRGNGSARDALSALDQAVAGGGLDDTFDVIELVTALGSRDGSAVLVGVDRAVERGRDPRQLVRDIVESIRGVFLAHMGRPSAADASLVRAMSPATATRAIETLGAAGVDMRDALDPRIVLEVALIRLCRPEFDGGASAIAALTERIERLETGQFAPTPVRVESSATVPPQGLPAAASPPNRESSVPATAAPSNAAQPSNPTTTHATTTHATTTNATTAEPLPDAASAAIAGGSPEVGRLPTLRPPEPATARSDAPKPGGAADAARARLAESSGRRSSSAPPQPTQPSADTTPKSAPVVRRPAGTEPETDDGPTGPHREILDALSGRARTMLLAGRFASFEGTTLRYLLPNALHAERAEPFRTELEATSSTVLGRTVRIELGTEATDHAAGVRRPSPPGPRDRDPSDDADLDLHDLEGLVDAPADAGPSILDQITSAFPGAQIVE